MLKLYQAEWCPYCVRVRSRMTDLGISYININVPRNKSDREELIKLCGKAGIPTMVCENGKIIADDDDAIIEHLDKTYSK